MTSLRQGPTPFENQRRKFHSDDDSISAHVKDDNLQPGRKGIWMMGGTMDFPDLNKMKEMMGQAKQMQEQMEQKLAATVVEASSGGGVVTVRMNGKKEVLRVKIEPTAMGSTAGDLELLEDLIAAAVNEAGRRADEAMKSSVAGMMGGLGLPDLPGLG
jgi:nucleoid-associated protein EbfC